MRRLLLSGGAALAMLLVGFVARGVAAPSDGDPWRLVQGKGKSFYIIADGMKHKIVPRRLSKDELVDLAALPDGPQWSNGVLPTPTPIPTATPIIFSPAPRVGDMVTVTFVGGFPYSTRIAVTIHSVVDASPNGDGSTTRRVLLEWSAKNLGAQSTQLGSNNYALEAGSYSATYFYQRVQFDDPQYPPFPRIDIDPGQTVRGFLAYDIPSNAELFAAHLYRTLDQDFVIANFKLGSQPSRPRGR